MTKGVTETLVQRAEELIASPLNESGATIVAGALQKIPSTSGSAALGMRTALNDRVPNDLRDAEFLELTAQAVEEMDEALNIALDAALSGIPEKTEEQVRLVLRCAKNLAQQVQKAARHFDGKKNWKFWNPSEISRLFTLLQSYLDESLPVIKRAATAQRPGNATMELESFIRLQSVRKPWMTASGSLRHCLIQRGQVLRSRVHRVPQTYALRTASGQWSTMNPKLAARTVLGMPIIDSLTQEILGLAREGAVLIESANLDDIEMLAKTIITDYKSKNLVTAREAVSKLRKQIALVLHADRHEEKNRHRSHDLHTRANVLLGKMDDELENLPG